MSTTNIEEDIWHWYHNVSECYYHIQITIKYRKSLFEAGIEEYFLELIKGFKTRYAIEIHTVGFDRNHVHLMCQFLPKYSGGQVIRLIKSISSRLIFEQYPKIKKELWGGEFWTDGYYIGTISGRGDRRIIENYIKNQGREPNAKQLRLFAF
jgi:putative transposase